MANIKCGTIWKKGGTTLPTELRVCDATNIPVPGDLVIIASDGEFEFMDDTGGAATAANRMVYGICVSASMDGKLNTPGYTAGTTGTGLPNSAGFGGVGSRSSTMNPANQRFIAPLTKDDEFVISRLDTTAVVIGQSYAIDRVSAGNVVLDVADTQDVLTVTGYYEPDIRAGVATTAARVWVKPALTYQGA